MSNGFRRSVVALPEGNAGSAKEVDGLGGDQRGAILAAQGVTAEARTTSMRNKDVVGLTSVR